MYLCYLDYIGPRILISLMASLIQISRHYNYLKQIDNPINDMSTLINCVCSIISTLSESKYNEECFTTIIGVSLFEFFNLNLNSNIKN